MHERIPSLGGTRSPSPILMKFRVAALGNLALLLVYEAMATRYWRARIERALVFESYDPAAGALHVHCMCIWTDEQAWLGI